MKAEISIVRCASRDKETEEIRIITRLAMGKTVTATMTPEAFAQALTGKSDMPADLRLRNVELTVGSTTTAPASTLTFAEWCEQKDRKPVGWVREALEEAFNAGRSAGAGVRALKGFVLMPSDPTPEMLEEICLTKGFTENALRARYAALIAAGQKVVQDGD